MKKNLLQIIAATISASLMAVGIVWAWTEPSQAPPNANAPAPINVSATSQTKAGSLTVNEIYAGNFRAAPGVNTMRLMGNTGSGRIEIWDRLSVSASHGFGNFPDPQSGGIAAAGDIIATASPGTFTSGGSYLSLSARGGNLPGYPGQTYPVVKTDSSYIYFAIGGQYAAYLGNGNNYTNSTFGVGNVYAYANVYGPIFRDVNNGGYYLDPDATSRINTINADNVSAYANLYSPIFYDLNNTNYFINPDYYSQTNILYRTYGFNGPEYDGNNSSYYIDPSNYSVVENLRVNSWLYGNSNNMVNIYSNLNVTATVSAYNYYIRSINKWVSELAAGGVFGGMFGMWDNGACRSGNPLAGGACACPYGFTRVLLGNVQTVWNYWCYK